MKGQAAYGSRKGLPPTPHPWARLRLPCAVAGLAWLLTLGGCESKAERSDGDPTTEAKAPAAPNVLIVLVDALRMNHLGIDGYPLPTSPNIDAFADESVVFANAFSHSTWTKPSVATVFTSLYPAEHHLDRVGFEGSDRYRTDVLSRRLPTLPKRFRQGGYKTAMIGANVHIQRKTGFSEGFDFFASIRTKTAFELNDILLAWLDQGAGEKPFFAFLHYMDVHWPYDRQLPENSGVFGNTALEVQPPGDWDKVDAWARRHLDGESLDALRARYDEEIAYADQAFGELLHALRARGLYEETIIVVMADHGEGFNEHGALQHGYQPFDEVTHVPLVIRTPSSTGLEPGIIHDPVGLVDLMPTLLELAGQRRFARARGTSLVPLMKRRSVEDRPIYMEGLDTWGLRTDQYKLLVSEEGETRCFDLSADAAELDALSGTLPPPCRRLAERLSAIRHRFEEQRGLAAPAETVPLDEDDLEALRSLGYLGP